VPLRIGFDMLAVQSPHADRRTAGESSRRLVSALLNSNDGHECFLYVHDALPADRIPTGANALTRRLGPDELTLAQRIDRLSRVNPDGLDVLIVLDPFEPWSSYVPPARRPDQGPRMAALIHDLSPFFLAGEDFLDLELVRHYRALEELKRYDALLAVSEPVRRDCLRLLGGDENRVTTIGGASDDAPVSAARVVTVLGMLPPRRLVPSPPRGARQRPRPRIAFFSPLPPRKSGVSDYAALLLQELKQTYAIDMYHATGYVPEPALAEGGLACCDARLFPRQAAARDYHAIVYQMGNSRYHRFLYDTLLRHPGVVTLHDVFLGGFHMIYGHQKGREREFIRKELLHWYPDQAAAIAQVLDTQPWNRETITLACAERSWFLNRRVAAAAERVIVHSPWCLERVRATAPEDAERMVVIPHGIWTRETSAAERAAIRARFCLPRDALVIGSFGFVHPEKMSREALDAFGSVARSDPSALFIFAGEEADGGIVRRHAESLGLSDRVRFLGRQPMSDFTDLIAACDLGVNLRMPPTHGETSGALLHLLAAGVATIVTDVGTFSDYPDTTVRKVKWETEGLAGLERVLTTLATDAPARAALGRAAQAYTRAHHEWPRVAQLYVDVIENSRLRPMKKAR
jgi:glycosyltransferase involved in cell wall biosynthesis